MCGKYIFSYKCIAFVFEAILCVLSLSSLRVSLTHSPTLIAGFISQRLSMPCRIVIVVHARTVFDVRLTLYETDIFLRAHDGIAT